MADDGCQRLIVVLASYEGGILLDIGVQGSAQFWGDMIKPSHNTLDNAVRLLDILWFPGTAVIVAPTKKGSMSIHHFAEVRAVDSHASPNFVMCLS